MYQRFELWCNVTKGVMWYHHERSFNSHDEAVDFIENVGEGDYDIKSTPMGLYELRFKNCKFVCNFDPEDDNSTPSKKIIHKIDEPIIFNTTPRDGPVIVKSRLVSLEELACEALNRHSYLDVKRLRRELRSIFDGDHEYRHGWKFDPFTQKDECEKIKRIVKELENKPRRNRKKKARNMATNKRRRV